ncbi:MAG: DUF1285 domain-containing protein [Myxococcales bacterium]|nr:DUF1285 domain-containing protein [Myxococcales bacterium]
MSAPAPGEPGFEAWLDQVRRSIDLRIDEDGRWWHEGEPFVNQRLRDYFDGNLDVHPESGEPILRVGDKWCYVRVDDTAFFVDRFKVEGERLLAVLNTRGRWPVPGDGFVIHGERAYVTLAPHRRARLTRRAWHQLGEWLEEGPEGVQVAVAGRRWPVRLEG